MSEITVIIYQQAFLNFKHMGRTPKYIDIHLHPHGRTFNFLRNSKLKNSEDYNPWTSIKSNYKAMERGKRAFSFSQCNFAQCWNGDCAVVFAAIYPFEKGFFSGGGHLDKDSIFVLENTIDKIPLFGRVVNSILEKITGAVFNSEYERKSVKDYFQSMLMRMPGKRIEFLQSPEYDYWTEAKEEIEFILSRNGVESKSKILKRSLKKEVKKSESFEKAVGTYVVAKNFKDISDALDENKLVIVLTLEGAHSFGLDKNKFEVFNRIEELKRMEYPIFFVTFSHHFNNYLCGHAHSLIKGALLLANQNDGLQSEFNDLGLAAARLLLSLSPENIKNEDSLGRRILLDVKHMGVESREQLYHEIIFPCLHKNDNIPVIASHVCYSGVATFEELKENWTLKKETEDLFLNQGLNHWNINVCDQDIEVILKTNGLLGICLDERIMGFNKSDKQNGFVLLETNLERLLEGLFFNTNLSPEEKSRIWNVMCIGTDFEGYIDPTENYPTVIEFKELEKDLKSIIQKFIDSGKAERYFIFNTPEQIARDFCMDNVMNFLRENFN
ncbi:hypothetical protein SYJ56_19275 [Algoriphagus sp. D3-2-R+10]|uniref:hypothetical protein n=1 Tax=Algoriphagus aurantiacus TaxID=3103948 RepID=UPI002B376AA2|nr:hypothetical protein [Algoriphagus sp. D3-2-R+10]MEB2777465.1 hypothetical protein [Algoriphagus sp. D3-2-R+10]